jgi:hypothetical protein
MRAHLAGGGIIVAATHGPLGIDAQELRLESWTLPRARQTPSPLVGEGWGGGSKLDDGKHPITPTPTPTPDPSPQGGGERRR